MSYCIDCGHQQRDQDAFCVNCGRRKAGVESVVLASPPRGPHPEGATAESPASGGDPFAALGTQLRSVPWAQLIPLRSWATDGGWRRGRVGLFSLFAFAPFALLRLTADDQEIRGIAWGFAIYFALLWFVVLHGLIRPRNLNWWALGRVVLVTAVAGTAIAIFLERRLAPDDTNLVRMIVGVGLPEELAKALAVYLFVFRSRAPSQPRTYLFVGAVSGLAFGAAEAVSYTQKYAELAAFLSPTSYTALITWRLLTDSLLHATLAGICAFFIGLAYRYPSSRLPLVAVGLALSAVLHGAYDSLANGWPGTLMAGVIVFVFAGYVRSGDQIVVRLQQAPSTREARP